MNSTSMELIFQIYVAEVMWFIFREYSHDRLGIR